MAKAKDHYWISYADLMTLLMVIFLFVALAIMAILDYQQKQRNKLFEEYRDTKIELYNDLMRTFEKDMKRWDMEIGKDLSIKFTNPEVLFASGKSELTNRFQQILGEFFPKYLALVLKNKYRKRIAEIRIEGHTDTVPVFTGGDPYIDNMQLSQNRARTVLSYLRQLQEYSKLGEIDKHWLLFRLIANGLSYGRTLDSNKQLTDLGGAPIDNANSRRVEFQIVTTTEEIVEEAIRQLGTP